MDLMAMANSGGDFTDEEKAVLLKKVAKIDLHDEIIEKLKE